MGLSKQPKRAKKATELQMYLVARYPILFPTKTATTSTRRNNPKTELQTPEANPRIAKTTKRQHEIATPLVTSNSLTPLAKKNIAGWKETLFGNYGNGEFIMRARDLTRLS
jgi:hypothetical protein